MKPKGHHSVKYEGNPTKLKLHHDLYLCMGKVYTEYQLTSLKHTGGGGQFGTPTENRKLQL